MEKTHNSLTQGIRETLDLNKGKSFAAHTDHTEEIDIIQLHRKRPTSRCELFDKSRNEPT
jgi:hypothetical protein